MKILRSLFQCLTGNGFRKLTRTNKSQEHFAQVRLFFEYHKSYFMLNSYYYSLARRRLFLSRKPKQLFRVQLVIAMCSQLLFSNIERELYANVSCASRTRLSCAKRVLFLHRPPVYDNEAYNRQFNSSDYFLPHNRDQFLETLRKSSRINQDRRTFLVTDQSLLDFLSFTLSTFVYFNGPM